MTKFQQIMESLYIDKLGFSEVAALYAAFDLLKSEIENNGPNAKRMLEEYGTQIKDGIQRLMAE